MRKEQSKMKKAKICLRLGHGQNSRGQGDPGACFGNLKEDNITLKIGTTLAYLFSCDYEVILPRKDDNWIDKLPNDKGYGLRKAVQEANDAKCDLFLSLHCNSSDNLAAEGTEVVYASPKGKEIAEALARVVSGVLGTKNRGAKKDIRGLYELQASKMPAVILELGFLSNSKDRAILEKLMTNKELRVSLANAILAVLKKHV